MSPSLTPQQAREITRVKQQEADDLLTRIDRVVKSLKSLQKENGYAPRLAATFKKGL